MKDYKMNKSIHPKYYGGETNPFEVIKIIEHYSLNFSLGNVLKYVIRAGHKNPDTKKEDLIKAKYYIEREIDKL